MHYYQFNIGDYKSHTEHLSEMEDLAYRRLLDFYYLHEKPIENDINKISRQIRMRTHCDCIANVLREFFVLKDGALVVNEMAPRPHNSGRYTLDATMTSQFEQHLRAILDLPLGETSLASKFAVMRNVLGGEKSDMYRPYLHLMARTPGLHFHQYRKEVRAGRKIGHVTMCGENLIELKSEVLHAVQYMSGEIDE